MLWHNRINNRGEISILAPSGDPFKDPWTRSSLPGTGLTPVAPPAAGTNGRFAYSRGMDGVFLLNSSTAKVNFLALS
jgi:hypothetical protein